MKGFFLWFLLAVVLGYQEDSMRVADSMDPSSSCISLPWMPQCVNYTIPESNLTRMNDMLCMMSMPQCTVKSLCETPLKAYGPYCTSFSIYKSMCQAMPNMTGCEDYKSMCKPTNSVVSQCKMNSLPLPSQSFLRSSIVSICSSMAMDCSSCPNGNCKNPLLTYSLLCYQMSDMSECSDWINICKLVPGWWICTGEGSGDTVTPEMKMYFHLGFKDYILFQQWVPQDYLSYTISIIAVFLMAFLHEGIRILRIFADTNERTTTSINSSLKPSHPDTNYGTLNTGKVRLVAPWNLKRELLKGLFRGVDMSFHFLVMLVAMTFNVGLFVSVIGGYVICHFLFGRFTVTASQGQMDCH